ncbi:hypothetical protein ANN_14581 [Periplaneta americana]|uniref:Mariner Mos1 transposase n=1 Tax=Periplaneta americana TaxID=6978 RepID=A0ABQ8SXS8_PERAM|nr:hypothetical protein ANN_14581 [Periplaneta americana]
MEEVAGRSTTGLHKRRSLSAAAPSEQESRLTAHRKAKQCHHVSKVHVGTNSPAHRRYTPIRRYLLKGWVDRVHACTYRHLLLVLKRGDYMKWKLLYIVDLRRGLPIGADTFIPEGRTVSKKAYVAILRRLRDAVRRRRPNLWQGQNWVLLHDNTLAHRSFLVSEFLTQHKIHVHPQPPYSPADFYLFPKIKSLFKGQRIASAEKVKIHATRALREVTKDGLQKCFEKWYGRWQKCVTTQGAYFEGGVV